MTKRFQHLISCLLALGLVLAGWVAFSPELHVAIEHGGRGPAHVHFHGSALSFLGRSRVSTPAACAPAGHHELASALRSGGPTAAGASASLPLFRSTHRPFVLPGFSVRAAWDALVSLAEPAPMRGPDDPSPEPRPPPPAHDHHSLAQTLADGCLESCLHPVFQKLGFVRLELPLPTWYGAMLEGFFDAQTAGRAPPPLRS